MASYTHLSLAEREELSRLVAAGAGVRACARSLSRSPSTISRELRRDHLTRAAYRATAAHPHAQAQARARHPHRKLDRYPTLQAVVCGQLAQGWSPEQIARRLRLRSPTDMTMRLSHETIYTSLYVLPRGALKRELLSYLRQRRPSRRRRGHRTPRHERIPSMLSIEERPAAVADRTVPGHWEGDLLVGRRNASALGTLVERTTRATLLVPLQAKDARSVRLAFARELRTLPQQLRVSLTYDQGTEMAEHRLFTKMTRMRVYFAHPHSPWERGTNENTNGLLRQFFPKGTDFTRITPQQIKHVQWLLNGRPRKVLQWRTPAEVFPVLLH